MTRPVRPSSWVTCSCGRICKGRAGLATHARTCPIERARSAAFIAAIEQGRDSRQAANEAVQRAIRDQQKG